MPLDAVRDQGAEDEVQPLSESADDDSVRRFGAAGSHPPVVRGQHRAKVRVAFDRAVAEIAVGMALMASPSAHSQSRVGNARRSGTP